MKIIYKIINPNGNITALVLNKVKRAEYSQINKKIMQQEENVEQCAFVKKVKDDYVWFDMAGLEFCGNATRAVAYYANKVLQVKKPIIKTCGLTIKSEITNQNSKIIINKNSLIKNVKTISHNEMVVYMKGITHIVISENSRFYKREATKDYVKNIISLFKIKTNAVGVIFLSNQNEITPIVWVKNISTFFYETACVSGSIACAIFLGKSCDIIQPSTAIYRVEITQKELIVNGECEFLNSGYVVI